MLGVVSQQCWVRLHIAWGSLELRHVSLPHLRVVLLLKLCSVKKLKESDFSSFLTLFFLWKNHSNVRWSVSVEDQRSSFVFALKENRRSLFASEKLLLVRVAPQLEIYPWTLLLLRNAPHLVGKAPIEETRTEKREGAGKKDSEINKRFIRLSS